jgi:hypothetical protein
MGWKRQNLTCKLTFIVVEAQEVHSPVALLVARGGSKRGVCSLAATAFAFINNEAKDGTQIKATNSTMLRYSKFLTYSNTGQGV